MSEIPPENPSSHSSSDPSQTSEFDDQWRRLFESSESGLRAFLRGRLAQDSDVDDCLQFVFVKLLESGDQVLPSARRAWMYRVAANESARLWRSKASTDRMLERHHAKETSDDDPTLSAIAEETAEQLRQAIGRLPENWRKVVSLRIYENLTFQQIANRLDIPLGTALTQMRRALERLRNEIESKDL